MFTAGFNIEYNWADFLVKIKPKTITSQRVQIAPAGSSPAAIEDVIDLTNSSPRGDYKEEDSSSSNPGETNMMVAGRAAGFPFMTTINGTPSNGEKYSKWPKCAKTYNAKWEEDPILKTWIARHPHDTGRVICRHCHSVIRAHKNDLLEHTRTLKHQRNYQQNTDPEVFNLFVMELNGMRKEPIKPVPKRKRSYKAKLNGNSSPAGKEDLSDANSSYNNSNNNNNYEPGSHLESNSGSPQSSATTMKSRPAYLGGSNSIGFPGVDPGGDLVGEDLWNADVMSNHTPRDYLKVILEVPSPDQPSGWITDLEAQRSHLVEQSQNISANSNQDNESEQEEFEEKFDPDTEEGNEEFIHSATQPIGEDVAIPHHQPQSQSSQLTFDVTDVIDNIRKGCFNVGELTAVIKAAVEYIEETCSCTRIPTIFNDTVPKQEEVEYPELTSHTSHHSTKRSKKDRHEKKRSKHSKKRKSAHVENEEF